VTGVITLPLKAGGRVVSIWGAPPARTTWAKGDGCAYKLGAGGRAGALGCQG
jgi:hypothetical protein